MELKKQRRKVVRTQVTQKLVDKLWKIRRDGYFVDWEKIKNDI